MAGFQEREIESKLGKVRRCHGSGLRWRRRNYPVVAGGRSYMVAAEGDDDEHQVVVLLAIWVL
ncbi:hypothetical protein HanXRQr2_Chr05g0212481 [Helianthus annuus]|uniref:Uncharacterized protein n=1 Tax=Helianthus annuus TaxID=4232 RepID=A0A9K3IZE6_HELAN|nr:hypothetical protein HanXRQr2_Chr05g0212481 [Helianthus annuus]